MKNNVLIKTGGIFILAVLCMGRSLQAQDTTIQLTLKDAIDLSIKNSKQLKGSRARIDEAVGALQEAKDKRLPDVKISGSYLRINNPNIVQDNKSNSSGGSGNGNSSLDLSQAMYGMANVSYPIYTGQRIQYGIESAKYLEQATRLDADNDRDAVVLNTINAYLNLYKAKAAVDLVKENLQQSRQRDTDFINLEKNGIIARNDLLKVQLQTSNIELSLLDAENNRDLANVNMNLLLGLPEKATLVLDSNNLLTTVDPKTLTDYEQQALQSRKDMQALGQRGKAATTGIKAAKGEYYPSVALSGGYIAADIPGFITITNAVNVGLGVQYSLSSLWKTKAKVAQAKAREQEVMANEELLSDNIRLQVNQAYQAYLLSRKKIDVYAVAIDQAAENYKITKNKYENSLVTTTDLLDADVAQLQARLNYVLAKADAVAAYDKLLQVSGVLVTK